MLDGRMRRLIDPPLDRAGRRLAGWGISAAAVTLFGLALGLGAALVLALGLPGWAAIVLLLAGRVADGLDGAVARASASTDFGGFLDIFCDFVFYGALPLAFALRDPASALPAVFLLFSFYVNAASFLGFAILAEKRGIKTSAQGQKSLYFSAGLMEGSETILFFVAMCLLPGAFGALAWVFGGLCLITAAGRASLAWRVFGAGAN